MDIRFYIQDRRGYDATVLRG